MLSGLRLVGGRLDVSAGRELGWSLQRFSVAAVGVSPMHLGRGHGTGQLWRQRRQQSDVQGLRWKTGTAVATRLTTVTSAGNTYNALSQPIYQASSFEIHDVGVPFDSVACVMLRSIHDVIDT